MNNATIQIIQGPEFISQLQEAILSTSFIEMLKAQGLAELLIDTKAVMQILGVKEGMVAKYAKSGKDDMFRKRHILPRHYLDSNKPYYKLIEVLDFKKIK